MAVDLDTYILELRAKTDRYSREITRAQRDTDRHLGAIDRRFHTTNRNVSRSVLSMGGVLGGISAYLGTAQLKQYADSWNSITRSLEAGESIFGVRLRSAEELNKLANDARADNDALAKLYVRISASTRELGAAEEDRATAATTVAKALKLGSASASEQTSTMLQLSQAFQKGKLDGDEFRTVMENAGVIQELLADKLKVSKGEIVRMAADGKLSVQTLFQALVEGADKVDRIFRQMPATIDESLTVLNNNIEQYIGKMDRAYGSTEAVVSMVKMLSDNIEPVGDAAIVAGTALLAAFSPRIVGGIAALAVGFGRAVRPIGLIGGALAGGAAYAELFGDEMRFNISLIQNAIDQGADFGTAWGQAFSTVDKEGVTLQDTMRALVAVTVEEISRAFETLSGALNGSGAEALQVVKGVLNVMIGAGVAAAKTVSAIFTVLPQAIGSGIIETINAIIRGVQQMLDMVADGYNQIVGLLGKLPGVTAQPSDFAWAPDLGQIENPWAGAGERAGEAFVDALSSVTRDSLGEWTASTGQYLDGFFDRVAERARDNSYLRQWTKPIRDDKGNLVSGTEVKRSADDKPTYPNNTTVDKEGEKRRRAFERDLLQAEQRIELARTEADAIGRSAYEVEYMEAKQHLLNEARKAGVELTEDDLIKIEALAQGTARAVTEAKVLRDAYEDLKDESKEFLSSFITDMKDGASASEALSGALDRIANKLIDMAVENLVESALGGLTGKGGNASGSSAGGALLALLGYSGGGYTGPGGKQQPAGVVHKGEVVWSQDDVARAGGVAAVEALRRGMPGYASGGPVAVPNVTVPTAVAAPSASSGPPVNLNLTMNVQNGTPEGIDKLKAEIVPLVKQVASQAIDEKFSRSDVYQRMAKR